MLPSRSFVRTHISVVASYYLFFPTNPSIFLSLSLSLSPLPRRCNLVHGDATVFICFVLCAREAVSEHNMDKKEEKKSTERRGKKNQWKAKRTGDYRTIINLMTLLCCNTPEIFWAELFKCLQHKRVAGYTASATRLIPPANTDTRAPAACMNFTGIYRA